MERTEKSMVPSGERLPPGRIAALQEEIRAAGGSLSQMQWCTVVPPSVSCVLILTRLLIRIAGWPVPLTLAAIADWELFGGLALSVGVVAAAYQLRRRQLRVRLAPLPRDQQLEVLLGCRDHDPTRWLTRRLCRDLKLENELAPADAPHGRGTEAACVTDERG